MPSGVVGTWVPSSIFSASSLAVISSTPEPIASMRVAPARRRASSRRWSHAPSSAAITRSASSTVSAAAASAVVSKGDR